MKYFIELYGKAPAPDNVFVEISNNKLNDREFQWKEHTVNSDISSFSTYVMYVKLDEPSLFFGDEQGLFFESIEKDTLSVKYTGGRSGNMGINPTIGELWVRIK